MDWLIESSSPVVVQGEATVRDVILVTQVELAANNNNNNNNKKKKKKNFHLLDLTAVL